LLAVRGTAAALAAVRTGSSIVKVDPAPSVLAHTTEPWSISTYRRTM
jgi:hypothetical protein